MKVCVVTRKLTKDSPAVVSAVFTEPDRKDIDDINHYFKSRAEEHAEEFGNKFVEFKRAKWETTILDAN